MLDADATKKSRNSISLYIIILKIDPMFFKKKKVKKIVTTMKKQNETRRLLTRSYSAASI